MSSGNLETAAGDTDGEHDMPPVVHYLNGGYWPTWKHYEGVFPSSVPLGNITHVNYAFADIDGDGTVYLADEYLHYEVEIDGANGGLRAWTNRKKENPELNVLLAVGGGGSDMATKFAGLAPDKARLNRFVDSIKHLIETFDLDGVDIDWEYPSNEDEGQQCCSILAELRRTLGSGRWVTIALPAGQWVLENINLAGVCEHVDFINLMAYDFVGPTFAGTTVTGHHAQLFPTVSDCTDPRSVSGAGAVEYLLDHGVPASKVVLGIPAYGRTFSGADDLDQPFGGSGSGHEASYEVKDLPKPHTSEVFDETAIAVYATGDGEFITYDNHITVRKKAEYVKLKGLRGLFYWHLAGDRSGEASLVRAGYQTLRSDDGVIPMELHDE